MNMFRLALALCALGAPTVLAAEPSRAASEEAKRHFQRSKELYDDGDLGAALNELERSYASVANFKLLYNMGQIQAQLQNHAAALKSFQRFLLDGANEVPETRRTEVLREIDKLRTRVAELTIVVPYEGADLFIDDVQVGKSPLSAPIVVNVGKRRVSATLQNYFPLTKQVDVLGLDTLTVRLDLQPMVSRTTPSATDSSKTLIGSTERSTRFPVWVPWAITGALTAGTVVTGILALGASAKQKTLLETTPITPAQQTAAAADTRTKALVTDILGACAIAAGIGSLVFTLVREPDEAPTALRVGVGPGGLVITGVFQ